MTWLFVAIWEIVVVAACIALGWYAAAIVPAACFLLSLVMIAVGES